MTLDVIKDIFGGILSNSTISGGVFIFGGVPVGGGIVILPGVGAPHQPHPQGGNYTCKYSDSFCFESFIRSIWGHLQSRLAGTWSAVETILIAAADPFLIKN